MNERAAAPRFSRPLGLIVAALLALAYAFSVAPATVAAADCTKSTPDPNLPLVTMQFLNVNGVRSASPSAITVDLCQPIVFTEPDTHLEIVTRTDHQEGLPGHFTISCSVTGGVPPIPPGTCVISREGVRYNTLIFTPEDLVAGQTLSIKTLLQNPPNGTPIGTITVNAAPTPSGAPSGAPTATPTPTPTPTPAASAAAPSVSATPRPTGTVAAATGEPAGITPPPTSTEITDEPRDSSSIVISLAILLVLASAVVGLAVPTRRRR